MLPPTPLPPHPLPQTFHNGSISPSKRRHHMLGFLGGGSSGHIVDSSDQSDDDDLSDAVDGVRTLNLHCDTLWPIQTQNYKEHQHTKSF